MEKYNSEILVNEFINFIKYTMELKTFEDKCDFIITDYISIFRKHFNKVYSDNGENVVGIYCTYDKQKNILLIKFFIYDDDMDKTNVNDNYSFIYGDLDETKNGINFESDFFSIQKDFEPSNFSPINGYCDFCDIQSAILEAELARHS